jgi:hypothetical protein
VLRTPISEQRNKHIQRVLVEAVKLGPKQSHELALVYEKEKQKGHGNRATLAVARKMVAYLLPGSIASADRLFRQNAATRELLRELAQVQTGDVRSEMWGKVQSAA